MRAAPAFLVVSLAVATVSASTDPPVNVGAQAKGARKVVFATVTDVRAAFGVNDFGDQLILSHVTFRLDETMKGLHEATVVVTLEGGTVGDLTLDVSDMPKMEKAQRAVLFLTNSAAGGVVPHGRGAGVMTLDDDDRVVGTNLTVDDVRAGVKAALAGGN